MKIGIDARFLTHPQCGGFKTYTRAVVSALAEADSGDQYILYTDRPFDPMLRLPESFEVRQVPARNGVLREQLLVPLAMKRDGVDLAHFPCNTAPMFPATKMVVTIHDAIPLRRTRKGRQPQDLGNRLLHSYWRAVIPRSARRAVLVITGSEYARDDLCARLALAPGRVRVIHLAIDPAFTSLTRRVPPAEIEPRTPFIVAFASPDGRKNHLAVMEAHSVARLGTDKPKLVLVCSHPGVRAGLARVAQDGVIPVGPVAVEELVWLYVNALALVFPSLDEGFGLPPLEAMSCGTPVLVSNRSPMPDLLGDCAVYVDPLDPAGIAEGMRLILEDQSLRVELMRRGRVRAARFTRENMGRELTAAYSAAGGLELQA